MCWKAINAADGSLVEPECHVSDTAAKLSGSTIKLDYVGGAWVYTTTVTSSNEQNRYCLFAKVTAAAAVGAAAKVLLRSLALLPDEGATEADYEGDYAYLINGVAERCVYRGGHWGNGATAGVFSLLGTGPRSSSGASIGFRSAYIPEIG